MDISDSILQKKGCVISALLDRHDQDNLNNSWIMDSYSRNFVRSFILSMGVSRPHRGW